jgi:hypothetical protein
VPSAVTGATMAAAYPCSGAMASSRRCEGRAHAAISPTLWMNPMESTAPRTRRQLAPVPWDARDAAPADGG